MKPTLKRLAALGALGAMGIAAPVASASAATPPDLAATLPLAAPQLPMTGLPGAAAGLPAFDPAALGSFTPAPLSFAGPSLGQVAAVIGPTVITSAPSTFNNTNIQVSAGGNGSGGQLG